MKSKHLLSIAFISIVLTACGDGDSKNKDGGNGHKYATAQSSSVSNLNPNGSSQPSQGASGFNLLSSCPNSEATTVAAHSKCMHGVFTGTSVATGKPCSVTFEYSGNDGKPRIAQTVDIDNALFTIDSANNKDFYQIYQKIEMNNQIQGLYMNVENHFALNTSIDTTISTGHFQSTPSAINIVIGDGSSASCVLNGFKKFE